MSAQTVSAPPSTRVDRWTKRVVQDALSAAQHDPAYFLDMMSALEKHKAKQALREASRG